LKKLLIFAKTIDGGTGTYLTNLLKLEGAFQNELVISVAVLERPIYMQRSSEYFYYMKMRDYSLERYSFSYKNLIDFIKELFWIRKIIQGEDPDIILAVDVNCNIHTGLTRFLFRKNFNTIFTTHSDLVGNLDQKSTKFLKLLLKQIITFFYNRSDSIICVSNELSNSLRLNFGIKKKIITIFNGLDIIKTPKKNITKKNNIILSVARLDKQKDHLTLLRAFELIIKEMKNAYLWLVGDGPLKDELKSFVTKHNLDKNVKFLGWQKNISRFFMLSDIFVLSSNREGFPYALIEAMSFGLPVVCTDTPYGPGEILDDGKYGFLVPMKKHLEIKEGILELLGNRETYIKYSQLSLERSKLFTSERMIKEYAVEIEKLL
jgi:glycosyltransferase involved in cell wall biosynthesis